MVTVLWLKHQINIVTTMCGTICGINGTFYIKFEHKLYNECLVAKIY